MSDPTFDDAPQWYWAADSGRVSNPEAFERSDDRFVIASGKRTLWARARREIGSDDCAWTGFGPSDGKATLADCMRVYLSSREIYGVSLNRLMLELCQIRSFAKFIKDGQINLGNWISNPIRKSPLPRPAYDEAVARQLGQRIANTLGLEEDWWVDL
ncbi:hypothetical protein ACVWZZ_008408 [Bradyrhizobium sp. LM6.10]|jgi:hypothetical protein